MGLYSFAAHVLHPPSPFATSKLGPIRLLLGLAHTPLGNTAGTALSVSQRLQGCNVKATHLVDFGEEIVWLLDYQLSMLGWPVAVAGEIW